MLALFLQYSPLHDSYTALCKLSIGLRKNAKVAAVLFFTPEMETVLLMKNLCYGTRKAPRAKMVNAMYDRMPG